MTARPHGLERAAVFGSASWHVWDETGEEWKFLNYLRFWYDRVDGNQKSGINSPVEYGKYPIIYQGFIMFYTSQMVIAGFLNHQQYQFVLAVMSFCFYLFFFSKNRRVSTQFSLVPPMIKQGFPASLCLDRGCAFCRCPEAQAKVNVAETSRGKYHPSIHPGLWSIAVYRCFFRRFVGLVGGWTTNPMNETYAQVVRQIGSWNLRGFLVKNPKSMWNHHLVALKTCFDSGKFGGQHKCVMNWLPQRMLTLEKICVFFCEALSPTWFLQRSHGYSKTQKNTLPKSSLAKQICQIERKKSSRCKSQDGRLEPEHVNLQRWDVSRFKMIFSYFFKNAWHFQHLQPMDFSMAMSCFFSVFWPTENHHSHRVTSPNSATAATKLASIRCGKRSRNEMWICWKWCFCWCQGSRSVFSTFWWWNLTGKNPWNW